MSVPKGGGLRERRIFPKPKPSVTLVPGDLALYHNWSGQCWIQVEILETHGARFRVKHVGGSARVFSAHRGALRKIPVRMAEPVELAIEEEREERVDEPDSLRSLGLCEADFR